MIDDYDVQRAVQRYADENRYTLIANTPGSLEFVKYEAIKKGGVSLRTLKWSKGSDTVTISNKDNKFKKYKIEKLPEHDK